MGCSRHTDRISRGPRHAYWSAAARRRSKPSEQTVARDSGPPLFFGDPVFDCLRFGLLPQLLKNCKEAALRIWVPRCSSGEDAYSVGMLALEAIAASGPQGLRILASDTDRLALEIAQRGMYPQSAVDALSMERQDLFFTPMGKQFALVAKALRDAILFSSQNILTDVPFSRLDLILARGMLGGFAPDVQSRLLSLLHFSLRERGVLVLGAAEVLYDPQGLFVASDNFPGVFHSVGTIPRHVPRLPILPGAAGNARTAAIALPQPPWLQHLVEQRLLEESVPAAVVLDSSFRIVSCYGPVHTYLRRPIGAASENVIELAHSRLKSAVLSATARALQESRRICVAASIDNAKGETCAISVVVRPIGTKTLSPQYLLMTFSEVVGYGDLRELLTNAENTIRDLQAQLRTAQAASADEEK